MAFPYIFESNFEQGDNSEWDSETDTEGVLNIRHYGFLSRESTTHVGAIAPWRGAYVAEWNLTGDTSDHTLIEGDIDIADTETAWVRFYLFLGKDLRGVTDVFNIYEHQGTANAVEAAIGLRITTSQTNVEIGIGQTAPTTYADQMLERNKWYCVELKTVVQTGGTGTSDLYVNGSLVASIDTITNTAVLRGVLGTQNTLNTTLGHLYISEFAVDDARLYPARSRFPVSQVLTKSGHAFVGPGWIESCALLTSTGSLSLYDTDTANTNSAEAVVELDASRSIVSFDGGAYFERGCYVSASTDARTEIKLVSSNSFKSRFGPTTYGNVGVLRQYGSRRSVRNQNV